MYVRKFGAIVLGCALVLSMPVRAEVYHYLDESGKRVYVDRMTEVPEQFRDQLRKMGSKSAVVSEKLEEKKFEDMTPEEQRAELQSTMRALETSVSIQGNRVLLPVSVRYGAKVLPLNLVLDTGASRTVIHNNAIAYLKMPRMPSGPAKVADGSMVNTHLVTFKSMLIGPYTLAPAVVSALEHEGISGYDGLLGMDFLRQVKYDVDYERNLIIWKPEQYRMAQESLKALDEAEEKGVTAVVQE
jgi:predicted aspartyl protease